MKKVFMTLAAVLMGMTAVNAQVVVGGNIGFNAKSSSITKDALHGITDKTPATFSMAIAPKVGYLFLDGKMEAGAALHIGYDQETTFEVLFKEVEEKPYYINGKAFKDQKASKAELFVNPYARYRVFEKNGFGIWVNGVVSLGGYFGEKVKYYSYEYEKQGRNAEETAKLQEAWNKDNELKRSNFVGGLYIAPVLTYDINEHWRLETGLNFLGFNLSGAVTTSEEYKNGMNKDDGVYKQTYNTCSFGLNIKDNVLNISSLSIGAAYKF